MLSPGSPLLLAIGSCRAPTRALLCARVRLGLAVAVMLAGALDVARAQLELYRLFPSHLPDPAPLFYIAGAAAVRIGLASAR